MLRRNLPSIVFLAVLAISLSGNVYLERKILVEKGAKVTVASAPLALRTGQELKDIHAEADTGKVQDIQLIGNGRTLIYVFSPNCHWCMLNYENLQALYSAQHGAMRFVGLATDSKGLENYLAHHPYPFPIYRDPNEADLAKINYVGTPQTLIVDTNGKVIDNWGGAYINMVGDEIAKNFSVHFPGLTTGSRNPAMTMER